jgi:hypothetical protein
MNRKPMGKKTALLALVGVIIVAVLLGLLMLNKGDGPVAGVILSRQGIATTQEYADVEKACGEGVYLVSANAFNKFEDAFSATIPGGSALNATVHFVECAKGSVFTAQWSRDGAVIAQEAAALATEPQGVIAYALAAEFATPGNYTFTLLDGGETIFEHVFQIV